MEKGDTDFATVIRTRTGLNAINPTLIRFYWQEMLEAVKEIHDKSNNFFFFVLFFFFSLSLGIHKCDCLQM